MRPVSVAIVGAGWAGCAAAVELVRRGARVTLYEATRIAGGRARRIVVQGQALDNGQHILLGAYRDSLHLMRTVGLEPAQLLMRLPLQMCYPVGDDGMQLRAPRLPAPLHLAAAVLRARGLSLTDKRSLARFTSAARWMGWQLDVDCTVSTLLERFDQTERLIALLWRPLCIAALNTPPERASAKIFFNVLRDSLGGARSASDMLLPRVDLSALFPEAALAWVQKHGGAVHLSSPVNAISYEHGRWTIGSSAQADSFSHLVIATGAAPARRLLAPLDPALASTLDFGYESITTCYLQYPPDFRLPHPMLSLRDSPQQRRWGQFVFDRGQLDPLQAGLMAVVVSASAEATAGGADTLAQAIAGQLAEAFELPALAEPLWRKVVTEKRATFACTPGLARPPNATRHPGLWLAGDYTAGAYPATIEGAARSGLAAASGVLQSAG